MAGYTEQEVQQAARSLLLSEVSMGAVGSLAARDIVDLHRQVYELVATSMILTPDAVYSLLWLSKNGIVRDITRVVNALSEILTLAPLAAAPSVRVTDQADLARARAQLLRLQTTASPAEIDRVRSALRRFIAGEVTPLIVSNGQVVESGEEVRDLIRQRWQSVQDPVRTIPGRVQAWLEFRQNSDNMVPPPQLFRNVVNRILAKIDEISTSVSGSGRQLRLALLDLLTIQTILPRATRIRAPSVSVMPQSGDPTTGVLVDSGGVRPSVTGTISSPYTYGPGESLDFEIDGAAESAQLPLFAEGCAPVLRSRPLTWPNSPSEADSRISIEIDRSYVVTGVVPNGPSGPFVDGDAAALLLDSRVSPEVSVTYDPVTLRLVFTRNSTADGSYIRFVNDDPPPTQTFLDWIIDSTDDFVELIQGRSVAYVEAQKIVDTTGPLLDTALAVDREELQFLAGSSVGGTTALVTRKRADTTGLYTPISATQVEGPVNLESAGVLPGDVLDLTTLYPIVSVAGSIATVEGALPGAPAAGFIGSDLTGLPVGARVHVSCIGRVDGFYRLASAEVGLIEVDRTFLDSVDLTALVYTEVITASSPSTTTSSSIEATAGGAQTVLGMPAGVQVAQLSALSVPSPPAVFSARHVTSGMRLHLTSPTGSPHTALLTEVEPNRLHFDPPVTYEAGSWTFRITSPDSDSYESSRSAVVALDDMAPLFQEANRVVNRFLSSNTSPALVASLEAVVSSIQQYVTALGEFDLAPNYSMRSVVALLREQGFDRALDILLYPNLKGFFDLGPDDVSYSTHLLRESARITSIVAPIPRNDS